MKKTVGAAAAATLFLTTLTSFAGEDIPYDQLPQAVQLSIEKLTPSAAIQEIERESKRDLIFYEVEYLQDGAKWEIHVAEDGRVLKHELD